MWAICPLAGKDMFCKVRLNPFKLLAPLFSSWLIPYLLVSLLSSEAAAATNFSYNSFDASAQAKITCFDSASFADNSIQLTATGAIQASGRCLYNTPLRLLDPATRTPISFSTQFIFNIDAGSSDLADGLAFIIVPNLGGVVNSSQGYLGIFSDETNGKNSTHTLAIEFDTYKNPEFEDKDENHVGIDVNDIISWLATSAAYRTSSSPAISSAADGYAVQMKGSNVQVWIDFDVNTNQIDIAISRTLGIKPRYPLVSNSSLNLSDLFNEEMYVGFSASTGPLSDVLYHVYAWSFGSNGSVAADLSLPESKSKDRKAVILGSTFGSLALIFSALGLLYLYLRKKRLQARQLRKDEWQVSLEEHLPQEFRYRELAKATHNFSDKNRLGSGGFGEVFQGVIPSSGVSVAVKRISKGSKQGVREFVSEVTTIGRLRHRNLVPLLGWCQERGFMLVYELMPNGSLDRLLFNNQDKLPWNKRLHILRGVAASLLYLHEECEQKIVHRDIKASNVMLDSQMNARLGDFGLARLYGHDVVPTTTNVAGTWGYMAPESFFTRKATEKTDVFSFGALTLEVATGKKMGEVREKDGCSMIEWLWKLQKDGSLVEAIEPSELGDCQETDHMVKVVLELGLLCCYPDPVGRPSMRRIVQVLDGDALPPSLPSVVSSSPYFFSSLALSAGDGQESTNMSAPCNSDDSNSLLLEQPSSMSLQCGSVDTPRTW